MTQAAHDNGKLVPPQLRADIEMSAAWLYYSESCTQEEVAQILGVSRASVANYLSSARSRGLVEIRLAPDILAQVRLSKRIMEQFRLESAHVLPLRNESNGTATLRMRLGAAGAHALVPHLQQAEMVGVAWGRTMSELGKSLTKCDFPGLGVVQISGSSLGGDTASPEACTALIAHRLGAKCFNFHAPAVVTSPSLRTALMDEPTLKRHFERIRRCGIVVFGVGELTPHARWADTDRLIRPSVAAYLRKGCVGMLIGRFIDAQGKELAGPLAGRQIGMELDELREVPKRFCVAGGDAKLQPLRSVLSGGYATHLVTDENTAQRLLGDE